MSEVGFEPTPPFGDQNAQSHESWEGINPWVWRLRPLGHPDNPESESDFLVT